MKYYKDDCHHYKVKDDYRVVTITDLGKYESTISYARYGGAEHSIIRAIKTGTVKPCTKADFDTAFDKALNTIKNLK